MKFAKEIRYKWYGIFEKVCLCVVSVGAEQHSPNPDLLPSGVKQELKGQEHDFCPVELKGQQAGARHLSGGATVKGQEQDISSDRVKGTGARHSFKLS